MSFLVSLGLFSLATLLQATVLSHLRVFGGQPDLIVLLVIMWSILDHDQEGMIWGFTGGLFLDLLSGTPLGLSSLVLVPIAYVVGLTEARAYRSSLILPLLLTAGGALAYHLGYLFLMRFFGNSTLPLSEALGYVTLPSVLFDIILAIPFLRLLARWYDRLHPRPVKF